MSKIPIASLLLLMRTILIISILMFAYIHPSFSQDTTYRYYDKGWQECNKDSAYYYSKIFKQDELWGERYFWVKGNMLYREGVYLDNECKTGQGTFKWYRENGTLKNTTVYEQGKRQTADYFYESGKKKGHIIYTSMGSEQQGWDENGIEIPNYIVERGAMFSGGSNGWKAYLERNLDANVAARAKAPIGIYSVKVQFIVDKEGNVSDVQATEVPSECKPCGKEAVRIIKKGPKWGPAIQDNKPVIYQAFQYISWQVAGE